MGACQPGGALPTVNAVAAGTALAFVFAPCDA